MIMKIEPIDRALSAIGVGGRDARAGRRAGDAPVAAGPALRPGARARVRAPRPPRAGVRALQGRRRARDASISSTTSCRSATSCSRAASRRRCASSTRSLGCCRAWSAISTRSRAIRSIPGCSTARTTRGPPSIGACAVPEVLLSGNHAHIARHRREESLRRTFERRPDLLESADLSPADRAYLESLRRR